MSTMRTGTAARSIAISIGVQMLFACAATADVQVFAGYFYNLSGPPNPADVPDPFDSSATTTLIASGSLATPHDTGVLRFYNDGLNPVSINPGLNVVTQGAVFQIWDGFLPFLLGPGQNLVL